MKFLIFLVIAFFGIEASAQTLIGNIDKVGCHIDKTTCFVYLESKIDTSCPNKDKSLRWNGADSINSGKTYSMFLAALASGKGVTFGTASDLCYEGYPSFRWAYINK